MDVRTSPPTPASPPTAPDADRGPAPGLDTHRAELELAALVDTMTHDLRAPLRNIRQAAMWLDELVPDQGPAARHCLGFLHDASCQLDHVVGALASYTRVLVATGSPDREPLSVDDVLDDAVAAVRQDRMVQAERRARDGVVVLADWHVRRPDRLPWVVGDRELLGAMLRALLANAVEYCQPHREAVVEVRGDIDGRGWWVEVADDGLGIDEPYLERVFEPFRRLWTFDEHPGAGLGLTLARRVAEASGGSMSLRSAPGRGTTVRVEIPHDPPAQGEATGGGETRP